MNRRRLAAATAAVLALGLGIGAPVATAEVPSTPYSSDRTWGCIDQKHLKVGICIGDPFPWMVPGMTR